MLALHIEARGAHRRLVLRSTQSSHQSGPNSWRRAAIQTLRRPTHLDEDTHVASGEQQRSLKELAAQQTADESALYSHKKDIASHDRHRDQTGRS